MRRFRRQGRRPECDAQVFALPRLLAPPGSAPLAPPQRCSFHLSGGARSASQGSRFADTPPSERARTCTGPDTCQAGVKDGKQRSLAASGGTAATPPASLSPVSCVEAPRAFAVHVETIGREHGDLSDPLKSAECGRPSSSTNKEEMQAAENGFYFLSARVQEESKVRNGAFLSLEMCRS